jgi:hypothetical protein
MFETNIEERKMKLGVHQTGESARLKEAGDEVSASQVPAGRFCASLVMERRNRGVLAIT